MEVSKSRKRKSGVEDGDDQPNKKTKTDEAGGIHIFSMLYTHTQTHTMCGIWDRQKCPVYGGYFKMQ